VIEIWPSVAIVIVLASCLAAKYALHRYGAVGTAIMNTKAIDKRLEVRERVMLSANHSLYLIRADDQTLVLAVTPAGCQVLSSFAAREETR